MLLLQIGLQVAFFPEEEEEVPEQPVKFRGTLPENFTWGNNPCIPYNQLDQGSCGSCWATATTMAIGERRCLKYGKKQILAIEELVACDHTTALRVTNQGCNGGSPYPAMIYTNKTGTTTEECYKYYSLHTYYPYPKLTCQEKCDNGSVKPRIHTESPHAVRGEQNIMAEIYQNGPVPMQFYLYDDFAKQVKNGGIFQVKPGSKKGGGHSGVIIGWGVENGVKYWHVQNTYGKTWNGNGQYKIRRGQNDAMIEQYIYAANVLPDNIGKPDQNTSTNETKPDPEPEPQPPVLNPTVTIVAHPTNIKQAVSQNVRLQIKDIKEMYIYVYTSANKLYSQPYNPWLNPGDITKQTTVSFPISIKDPGTYYVQIKYDNKIIKTSQFTVTADTHTNDTKNDTNVTGPAILYPKPGMVLIKGDTLIVKTQGLENEKVYLDSNKGSIVKGQCKFVVETKYDGPLSIAVGSKSVNVIVLPKPAFDKQKYTARAGSTVTIQVMPSSFDYSKYASVVVDGVTYPLSGNKAIVKAPSAGTHTVTLQVNKYEGTTTVTSTLLVQ